MRRAALPLAATAAALILAGCRGMVSDKPPIHLNNNMDQQQRKDPQEESALFADGRAMRPRVDGTVPARLSDLSNADAAGSEDPVMTTGRSGDAFSETLPAGLTLDAAFLERGRQRFNIYCMPCHGGTGEGNGTVIARGMAPPPSFHDDRIRAFPLGQFYDVITHGVRNMPSYASQVPPADRWAIASYVRVLQRSRMATIDQVPADVAARKGWK
jgi:mono/diheme cytochrome c family protein